MAGRVREVDLAGAYSCGGPIYSVFGPALSSLDGEVDPARLACGEGGSVSARRGG